MSKRFKHALLWAVKVKSKPALDNTVKTILQAGYKMDDIKTVIFWGEIR